MSRINDVQTLLSWPAPDEVHQYKKIGVRVKTFSTLCKGLPQDRQKIVAIKATANIFQRFLFWWKEVIGFVKSDHRFVEQFKNRNIKKLDSSFQLDVGGVLGNKSLKQGQIEPYQIIRDHISTPFLSPMDHLPKELENASLQDLVNQFHKNPTFQVLTQAQKEVFIRFSERVVEQNMARDNEVFVNQEDKDQAYAVLSLSLKGVLSTLLSKPIEDWIWVSNILNTAKECFIDHTDAAYQSYLYLTKQVQLGLKTDSFQNQLLVILATLRAQITQEMAQTKGRKETHTAIGIVKLIGQERNLPGKQRVQIEDKQADIKLTDKQNLLEEFDQAYTYERIIDWVYAAVNGLPPFKKKGDHSPIIDILVTAPQESEKRPEEIASLYDAPSYDIFLKDPARFPYLTKKTIARLLIHFKVLNEAEKRINNPEFLDFDVVSETPSTDYIIIDNHAFKLKKGSDDYRSLLNDWINPYNRVPISEDNKKKYLAAAAKFNNDESINVVSKPIIAPQAEENSEAVVIKSLLALAESLCSEMDEFDKSEELLVNLLETYGQNPIFKKGLPQEIQNSYRYRTIQSLIDALLQRGNTHVIGSLLWKSVSQLYPKEINHLPPQSLLNAAKYHGIRINIIRV